jgi:hypothetical protein
MRNAYAVLGGEPERKSLLGSCGCRWKDNCKMEFKEMECERMDLVHLTADIIQYVGFVNTVMNFRGSVRCRIFDQILSKNSSHGVSITCSAVARYASRSEP